MNYPSFEYMISSNVVYEVEISGKLFGFFLEPQKQGTVFLKIPDAGGMADMSPKYPEQLKWLLSKIEGVKGLRRVWTTIWEIRTESVLREVEALFQKEGRLSKKPRTDFY